MSRTKLISLRLDDENIEAIEDILKGRKYLNRSRVINCLLAAMLHCCQGNGLFQILNCYDPVSDGAIINVSFTSKI